MLKITGLSIIRPLLVLLFILVTTGAPAHGCNQSSSMTASTLPPFAALRDDLRILSGDAFAGREPATPGHQKARAFLVSRFHESGLIPLADGFLQPFYYDDNKPGYNVAGWLPGKRYPNRYIVISAHYDHLGQRGARIFNGADDNASGVAAMLSLATYFTQHPTQHSLIFLATDAEESGLHGAYAFFRQKRVNTASVVLNINLDMIGQGGRRATLYVVQDGRHPALQKSLRSLIEQSADGRIRITQRNAQSRMSRLTRSRQINWRDASDYAVFGENGIPFVHIGTAPHPDYHTPSDTFENIDMPFFEASAQFARCVLATLDSHLSAP